MRNVEPKVFLIGKTEPLVEGVREWLQEVKGSSFFPSIGYEEMGSELIRLCAKRCYLSYEPGLNPNVTKVRNDLAEFIENILRVGHGSVLEHVSYNFAIENVSRVFTAEMNRHRAGVAISEGSLRYISFDDIPYWLPHSILEDPTDTIPIAEAKEATRDLFKDAFAIMERHYKELQDIWRYNIEVKKFSDKKKLTSLFRRIIGMGVATGGVWSINIRALRHIFTMRCSPHAEEEICYVASLLLEKMIEAEPILFRDFSKVDGYWQPIYNKV